MGPYPNKEWGSSLESAPPFSVERKYFDRYLADKAVKNGAELRTNTMVKNLKGHTVITKSGEKFTGKVIVGADGYRSRIAELAGFEIPSSLLISPLDLYAKPAAPIWRAILLIIHH